VLWYPFLLPHTSVYDACSRGLPTSIIILAIWHVSRLSPCPPQGQEGICLGRLASLARFRAPYFVVGARTSVLCFRFSFARLTIRAIPGRSCVAAQSVRFSFRPPSSLPVWDVDSCPAAGYPGWHGAPRIPDRTIRSGREICLFRAGHTVSAYVRWLLKRTLCLMWANVVRPAKPLTR